MDVVCERIDQHLFHMLPLNGKAAGDRRITNLRDNLKGQRPRFRVRADLTHRGPGDCAKAIQCGVERHFFPDRRFGMWIDYRIEPAAREEVG